MTWSAGPQKPRYPKGCGVFCLSIGFILPLCFIIMND